MLTRPEYRLAEIAGPVDKDRVHASRNGRCSRQGWSTHYKRLNTMHQAKLILQKYGYITTIKDRV